MYDTYTRYIYISIHALRVEGDNRNKLDKSQCLLFQSTPSVWRATKSGKKTLKARNISIHALRVEGDENCYTDKKKRSYFNPRPPCGGRLSKL